MARELKLHGLDGGYVGSWHLSGLASVPPKLVIWNGGLGNVRYFLLDLTFPDHGRYYEQLGLVIGTLTSGQAQAPVPKHVYWNPIKREFHHSTDNRVGETMPKDFQDMWRAREQEFPRISEHNGPD